MGASCYLSSLAPRSSSGLTAPPSSSLTAPPSTWTPVRFSATRKVDTGAALPIKDRYPPAAYDPADSRRRLALLIDGEMVSVRSYEAMLPKLNEHGVTLLTRVFAHKLKPDWSQAVLSRRVEWFRVEKFIPVHMQIAADAGHIARFRADNQMQGVCLLVADAETGQYGAYLDRPELQDVSRFCFGEHGGLTRQVTVSPAKTASTPAAS
jgi:hypothetical protein